MYGNLIEYVSERFVVTVRGGKTYILCPFHDEITPSCLIDENHFYCFGCGECGNSKTFIEKVGDDVEVGNQEVKKIKKPYRTIDENWINNLATMLWLTPEKLQYLYDRHLDDYTIQQSNIGYGYMNYGQSFQLPRYSIPSYYKGKLNGARYRVDPLCDDGTEAKYIGHPGIEADIYQKDILDYYNNIIYVGSQFDAAVLYHRYGLPCIAPPGETTFKYKWIPFFYKKNVLIWLDNDYAGYRASLKVYTSIKNICNAKIFVWGAEFNNKDDVKDFIDKYGAEGVYQVLDEYKIGTN